MVMYIDISSAWNKEGWGGRLKEEGWSRKTCLNTVQLSQQLPCKHHTDLCDSVQPPHN